MDKTQQSPQEFLGGGAGRRLAAANYDVRVLRTNGLLRKDEWVRFDEAVIRVARQRLGVVNRLRAAGLVYPAGDLGTLLVEWERLSDFSEAEQSMSLLAPPSRDRAAWDLQAVPIPITAKEFSVEMRHLLASRNRGSAIDVTNAELASAVVAEKLEDTVINGSTITVGGNKIYGLRNFPDRVTGSLSKDWADSATTGEDVVKDVLAIIAALQAKNMYGPYEIFVGTKYNHKLSEDYKSLGDKTIRERILDIDEVQAINTSARIPDGEVSVVQMTSNVIDLAVTQDITTVEWAERGGFNEVFMVFAAMAPRLKSDRAGQSGIAHYTKP